MDCISDIEPETLLYGILSKGTSETATVTGVLGFPVAAKNVIVLLAWAEYGSSKVVPLSV
jgi:hypothetical protein